MNFGRDCVPKSPKFHPYAYPKHFKVIIGRVLFVGVSLVLLHLLLGFTDLLLSSKPEETAAFLKSLDFFSVILHGNLLFMNER